MPSQSFITVDQKAQIKNAVVPHKIFCAGLAHIYYAYPQTQQWSYAEVQGALVFALDISKNVYHFKMVDLDSTGGLLWEYEVYENLEYTREHDFFHWFQGDECMIGFYFTDESEAKTFYKNVSSYKDPKTKPRSGQKRNASKGRMNDKPIPSSPQTGSFVHVAYMGYDAVSGFTSNGTDPSCTQLLEAKKPKESRKAKSPSRTHISSTMSSAVHAPLPVRARTVAPLRPLPITPEVSTSPQISSPSRKPVPPGNTVDGDGSDAIPAEAPLARPSPPGNTVDGDGSDAIPLAPKLETREVEQIYQMLDEIEKRVKAIRECLGRGSQLRR